jgi:predicted signal transduction protein with EAL and GGDEF domain
MASLEHFPLDTLKIDRAFVRRLPAREAVAGQIVQAIVTLSQALRLDVTAEGVETAEQATQLKRLGCDIGQGYLYSRPITADRMEAFVLDWEGTRQEHAGAPDIVLPVADRPAGEVRDGKYHVPLHPIQPVYRAALEPRAPDVDAFGRDPAA